MDEILLVGPEYSGKSFFLKQLKKYLNPLTFQLPNTINPNQTMTLTAEKGDTTIRKAEYSDKQNKFVGSYGDNSQSFLQASIRGEISILQANEGEEHDQHLVQVMNEAIETNLQGHDVTDYTTSTIGVDIVDLQYSIPASDGGGVKDYKITELGATTWSRWYSYFPKCKAVIFFIDISDVSNYPQAKIMLWEFATYINMEPHSEGSNGSAAEGVSSNPHDLAKKEILLICNKSDLIDDVNLSIAFYLLQLDEIIETKKNISLLIGSCLDKAFIEKVYKEWIVERIR
jgi:GTPase SAR1 family protein